MYSGQKGPLGKALPIDQVDQFHPGCLSSVETCWGHLPEGQRQHEGQQVILLHLSNPLTLHHHPTKLIVWTFEDQKQRELLSVSFL